MKDRRNGWDPRDGILDLGKVIEAWERNLGRVALEMGRTRAGRREIFWWFARGPVWEVGWGRSETLSLDCAGGILTRH